MIEPCWACKGEAVVSSYPYGESRGWPHKGFMVICGKVSCGNAGRLKPNDEQAIEDWNYTQSRRQACA